MIPGKRVSATGICRYRRLRKEAFLSGREEYKSSTMNPLIVFRQMVIILILILTGFYCQKKGFIQNSHSRSMSFLVANVFNPCLVLSSVLSSERATDFTMVNRSFLAAVSLAVLMVASAYLLTIRAGSDRHKTVMLRLLFIFNNMGFIGIPVVRSVLGEKYVIYVAVFNLVYAVLGYTLGISMMDQVTRISLQNLKKVINTGTVSAVLSLFLFYTGLRLPEIITLPVTHLGGAATPMCMIVTGMLLAQKEDLLRLFRNAEIMRIAGIKVVLPLLYACIMRLLPIPAEIRQLTFILSAMPVGNLQLMQLNERGWDTTLLSDCIVVTTIFSVISIPVLVFVYNALPFLR